MVSHNPEAQRNRGSRNWILPSTQAPKQEKQLEHQSVDALKVLINGNNKNHEEDAIIPSDSEWVISIKEKLNQAYQDDAASSWSKLCIYRVPHCLRDNDDKANVSQIVSLEPYHHNKRHLQNTEDINGIRSIVFSNGLIKIYISISTP